MSDDALTRALAARRLAGGRTLDDTMAEYGFDPAAERLNVLPNPNGSWNPRDWTAPQWLYDMAKAAALPGHAAQGGSWGADDVTSAALNVGMLGGAAGMASAPKGALAMGAARNAADALPMDKASRMARARDLGFTTPAYHGTGSSFDAFDDAFLGRTTGHDSAAAHFFTKDPKVAHVFLPTDDFRNHSAGGVTYYHENGFHGWKNVPLKKWKTAKDGYKEGANILPVLLNLGNQLKIPNKQAQKLVFGDGDWRGSGDEFAKAVLRAKEDGYDSIVIPGAGNLDNAEFAATQYVIFDPANIRSRFAAFDPAKRDSADLLGANRSPLLAAGVAAANEQGSAPARAAMANSVQAQWRKSPEEIERITLGDVPRFFARSWDDLDGKSREFYGNANEFKAVGKKRLEEVTKAMEAAQRNFSQAEKVAAFAEENGLNPKIDVASGGSVYLTFAKQNLKKDGTPYARKPEFPITPPNSSLPTKFRFSDHGQYHGAHMSIDPYSRNSADDAIKALKWILDGRPKDARPMVGQSKVSPGSGAPGEFAGYAPFAGANASPGLSAAIGAARSVGGDKAAAKDENDDELRRRLLANYLAGGA